MLMMIEKPRRSPGDRAWSALSRSAALALRATDAALMWPFRTAENRRLLHALGAMSDHDLRDIGLTRGDLRDATALPPGRDPSGFFAARRRGRRHGG